MNRRSPVPGAVGWVVAWVLVVSVGATAVWTVISRAGAGVAGELPVLTATPQAESPSGSGSGPGTATPDEGGPVTRTWRGEAGSVAASCVGDTVALERARPASGWRVEVDDVGPARVRVELETADERSRVRVEAVCRAGVPSFDVDTRDKG
jgi:hypothetical protein